MPTAQPRIARPTIPSAPRTARLYPFIGPTLLGWIAGTAWQLHRPELPGWHTTLALSGVALVLLLWLTRSQRRSSERWRAPAATIVVFFLLTALLADTSTSLRALAYQTTALDPALENQDVELVGRIASLPQRHDDAVRLRFIVEQATRTGRRVPVPAAISLGWSTRGADDAGLAGAARAGDRCHLRARLRPPHGLRNPHGFDFELWMWEQGLQATGQVRSGRHDPAPYCTGNSGRHPIERWRHAVRDAVLARAGPASLPVTLRERALGTVAALVTGDQQAITDGY